MSITSSRAKMLGAMKDLMLRWDRCREEWNDEASRNVDERILQPLEPRMRSAVTAMEKMGQILIKARHDCM